MCKFLEGFDTFVHAFERLGQGSDYINDFVEVGIRIVHQFLSFRVTFGHLGLDVSVHLFIEIRCHVFQLFLKQGDGFLQVRTYVAQGDIVDTSPTCTLVSFVTDTEGEFSVDDESLDGVLVISLFKVLFGTVGGVRHHDAGLRTVTDVPVVRAYRFNGEVFVDTIVERVFHGLYAFVQVDVRVYLVTQTVLSLLRSPGFVHAFKVPVCTLEAL